MVKKIYIYQEKLHIIRIFFNDKEKRYISNGTNVTESQVRILKGHLLNIEGER